MNTVEAIFLKNKKNEIDKWTNYFDIYQEIFSTHVGNSPKILEIGVNHGGGINLWREFFGEGSEIYGIDINSECLKFNDIEDVHIFIGSQENEKFLEEFSNLTPDFDIIIDDGGHTMNQQITSLKCLFPKLKDGGIYLCEDTHTSYLPKWGGMFRMPGTFLEFCKDLIDLVNIHHIKDQKLTFEIKDLYNISFYSGITVFCKKKIKKPKPIKTGVEVLKNQYETVKEKPFSIKNRFIRYLRIKYKI